MEFLDYLRSAARSETSKYTRFLQQFNNADTSIHVFHEGKDDPSFYSNYIERYKKKKQRIYYYRANNKNGVYAHFNKIDWTRYEKCRVLFLVDKDFRDILNETYPVSSNIFETKFYSIENYLVTTSMFSRSLRELLAIEDENLAKKITREFARQLQAYHREITPIISLILYYREHGHVANLNQVDLSKLFDFRDRVKRLSNCKSNLEKQMDVEHPAPFVEIIKHRRCLDALNNAKLFVRGKFELWFFIKFLTSLPAALNKDRKKGEPKFKLNISLSTSNGVQVLAPRLRIPSELKSFLDVNLK